ncbi:MAG: hypothetical protein ACYDD1_04420 [Caulobacteraceae bacterium]
MALPAAMQAIQDSPVLRLFYAFEFNLPATADLPAKTLRLLDGAGGAVTFDGKTFVGADGDYGSFLSCEALSEDIATEAPKFSISLGPLTDEAQAQLGAPGSQGTVVTIYAGFLDPVYLQPVSDPEVVWNGLLDIGKITLAQNQRTIALDVYCAAELMMLTDDGSTLTSSWHNQWYANELGFQFVDSVTHTVPWGASGPRPDQAINGTNYTTSLDRGGGSTTLKF